MEFYLIGKVSLKLWNMTARNITSNIFKYHLENESTEVAQQSRMTSQFMDMCWLEFGFHNTSSSGEYCYLE